MDFLIIILVILVVSKLLSALAHLLHLPDLVGQLVAGVLLAVTSELYPNWLPMFNDIEHNESFRAITELGVFFLMFTAGVETKPNEFYSTAKKSIWIALGGVIVPLSAGFFLGWLSLPESSLKFGQSLYLGVALSITAVPLTIKTLMDLGHTDTKYGKSILSAAILDDIIGLLVLSVLLGVVNNGAIPSLKELGVLLGEIALFFVLATLLGKFIFPIFSKWLIKKLHINHISFTLLLIHALILAVLAEWLQLHFIIGAFAAGLFFIRHTIDSSRFIKIKNHLETFTNSLFGPLFFTSIGLSFKIDAVVHAPFFVLTLIAIAWAGKVIGCAVPALFTGMNKREALAVGIGMNGRGAVGLIIAGIVLKAGLFAIPADNVLVQNLFSSVVIMAIASAIFTPILLRIYTRNMKHNNDHH